MGGVGGQSCKSSRLLSSKMALNLFWLTQCLPRQPPSLTLLPLLELKFSRPGPPKPACMGRNGAANRFPVQVMVRKNTLWQKTKKKKNAVHIPFWFSFSHYRKRRGEAEVNAILSVWLKKKMDHLWVCLSVFVCVPVLSPLILSPFFGFCRWVQCWTGHRQEAVTDGSQSCRWDDA